MDTHIIRTDTKEKNAQNEQVVFISINDVSKDFVLSYINFMRAHASLTPITEHAGLDRSAVKQARALTRTGVTLDRSPFSVVTTEAGAWITGRERTLVQNDPAYLACILSNRCIGFGVCECDVHTPSGTHSVLIQVFSLKPAQAVAAA